MLDFLCVDCRQMKSVQTDGGTGYATLVGPDASDVNHVACYTCADVRERRDMASAERFVAYLSSDGRRVTSWSGGTLADVVWSRGVRMPGFGGGDAATFIRARAADGSTWSGRGPGRGMYVRLRRVGRRAHA